MSGFCYEIDELLNEAIITGVPAIIVEGIDDISIYDEISTKIPFDVEVYAIENIEGFTEGCNQVISAIEELNNLSNDNHGLSSNILGIIDKDVRDYRNDIPEVEPLLVLHYYSIESHFVSEKIIANILSLSSKTSRDLVSDELCHLMMSEIEEKLLDLYYFSLESLRNSVDPEYASNFSYSYSPGRIYDAKTRQAVLGKKHDLDIFASSLGVSPCINAIKGISKGKWLIDFFSQELLNSMNGLQGKCAESSIETCKSCLSETFDKCLYRIKDGFTKNTIKSLVLSNVEGAEVQYIEDRIARIKGAA
ncbi:DUF4435 domain-containing protein [Salinivibrio sp. VYel4]|uniref:DUF4435 domain-containing protein n=1 Tax=Salinivibrio sp. VYel4 TaxID=2490491 RepID=UPI00128CD6D3|nr:DUF4435 domain-containing protein [Salinivibrio sp. VYel4]MPY01340.1 DUF4435 domain-containing protein [Salinivibrio sp. VYel4]